MTHEKIQNKNLFKFNLITFLLAIFPWYRHSVNMGNQRSSNKIETNFEKIQQKFINYRIQLVVKAYNFSVDHKCILVGFCTK